MESESENRLLLGCLRVFNGDLDAMEEVFAPDVRVHASFSGVPPMLRKGFDGIEFAVSFLHTPFPDIELRPTAFAASARTRTCKWLAKGTHGGPLFSNIAPLHLPVALPGAFMCRGDVERIDALWMRCEFDALFAQLGMAPSAPHAAR
ncbi:MAG TPA: ester cyclase [Myxococcales bacterium]|jgi:hypothetical protein